MLAIARAGAAEGTWLRAERQTAGRGRMGREWESPEGNLYASGLVRLRASDPAAPTLALVAAVALHEALAAYTPAFIKWPNDVMAPPALKMAGILLERADDAVVVGIGVNLAHYPRGLDRPVTSLAGLGMNPPAPGAFCTALASSFAKWLDVWRSDFAALRAAWQAAAHPRGTALSVDTGDGSRIAGSFDGLTADGALSLRLADGSIRAIHAGDVFLI